MRIAVVHNQPSGGARRALHGFGRQWRARHSIDVYTLATADDTWLDDAEIADAVYRSPFRPRRPIRLGLYLNDAARVRDLRDLVRVYGDIARRIDGGAYDVVLVDVCQFTLVPPVFSTLATPSVVYVHNGPARLEAGTWASARTPWARLRAGWHAPFERAYDRRLSALQANAARGATRVVANSVHTAGRVRAAYGVEADVCPPGVEVPSCAAEARENYVLSVGEIEPRKGFGFLVDALGEVPAPSRPALRIAAHRANPVEHERICVAARARGVDVEVVFDPSQPALTALYRRARAFVHGAHHEALGLAPLEAMACATPVVAVAEGGVTETVVDGETGILTPRVPAVFAAQLDSLLRDRVRLAAYGEAARRHVERAWSWPVRAAALEQVLTNVAQSRLARR